MSVNSRFNQLVIHLKKTGRLTTDLALGELLGTDKHGIGDMKFGRKSLKITDLANLLKVYPDLNPDWLMEGIGPMFLPDQNKEQEAPAEYGRKGIPLVSHKAIAGNGNFVLSFSNSDIIGQYIIPEWRDVNFLIRVTGKSMEPNYLSGDIIGCRVLNNFSMIQWNQCHLIACKDQGLMVKRIKPGKTDNQFICISDNPDFLPFEIDKKNITGIALIIGLIRSA